MVRSRIRKGLRPASLGTLSSGQDSKWLSYSPQAASFLVGRCGWRFRLLMREYFRSCCRPGTCQQSVNLQGGSGFLEDTQIVFSTARIKPPSEEVQRHISIPRVCMLCVCLSVVSAHHQRIHPWLNRFCLVSLQAFSLPGSMYLSILGGAVWGVVRALPLACTCVATGASLCYLLSAALGPAILTLPRWKDRLEGWSDKVQAQRANIISFLIVLRIAPLPPHWVVNVVCPHVGIGLVPFWISTFLGVFGVSVIHTTIGGGLDEMTSADDFHLLSWRNFLLLSSVVVGVLIPVGLRYYLRRGVGNVDDIEAVSEGDQAGDRIFAQGLPGPVGKGNPTHVVFQDESDSDSEGEEEDDVILEAGPVVIIKSPSSPLPPGSALLPSSSTGVLL
jgi:uncharacterized membrane protein YdjX (TVP38/TMEM64 family)